MENSNLTKHIPDTAWQAAAKAAKISPAELKAKYETALAQGATQEIEVTAGKPISSGDCVKIPFSVDLFKIIGLAGWVELCYSSATDWTVNVHICLTVADVEVWCTDYTLSATQLKVCFSPSVGVAKADFCISIDPTHFCFNISGDACYWAGWWHCAKFDKTLFCFK